MNTIGLLVFAVMVAAVLWAMLRGFFRMEDGRGLLPISKDATLAIASALLGAFALLMFALSAAFLAVAISR